MSKKHSFIKNSIVIVAGLAISAEGGYPRLDKIISCRGEAPELKDAFEAAMRGPGVRSDTYVFSSEILKMKKESQFNLYSFLRKKNKSK